jgi:hypothetical protein
MHSAFEQQFGVSPVVLCTSTVLAVAIGAFVYSLMFDTDASASNGSPSNNNNNSNNSSEEEQPNIGCRTMFRPTLEWQEVLSYHVCPAGLEFRMDFASGKNYARASKLEKGQKEGDVAIPGAFLKSAISSGAVETQVCLSDVPLGVVMKKLSEIGSEITALQECLEKAALRPDGADTRKEHRRIASALDRLQRDEVDAISTGALPEEAQTNVKARRKEMNRTIEGLREKVLARV